MTLSLIATAQAVNAGGTDANITVPAGVTANHLGILTVEVANAGAAAIPVPSGWKLRGANPGTGGSSGTMYVFTRLGGVKAGNVITVTQAAANGATTTAAWYDTGGRDIDLTSAVWTTASADVTTVTFPAPGHTGTRDVILVAANRTTNANTLPAPTGVTLDRNGQESTWFGGAFFGHAANVPSQTYTATWSPSGATSHNVNAYQFALAVPGTPRELLTDGGFETWAESPFGYYEATITQDSTTKHSGTKSAKVTTTASTGHVQGIIDFPINNTAVQPAGTQVVCSAWFLGPSGQKFSISGRTNDASGNYVGENQGWFDFTATGSWQFISTYPWDASGVVPGVQITQFAAVAASQTFWVDDASVAATVPFTESLPITETWTGAAGTRWPTRWWTNADSDWGASVEIDATNRGKIVSGSGAAHGTADTYIDANVAYLSSMAAAVDTDVVLDVTFPTPTDETYLDVWARVTTVPSGPWVTPSDGYYVVIAPQDPAIYIRKMVGGTKTDLTYQATSAWTANVARRVRFQVQGINIRVKIWDPAGAEPSTWFWQGTDASVTAAGRTMIKIFNGAQTTAVTAYVDNLTVSKPPGVQKFKLGAADPTALYVGSAAVSALYLGATQVWP